MVSFPALRRKCKWNDSLGFFVSVPSHSFSLCEVGCLIGTFGEDQFKCVRDHGPRVIRAIPSLRPLHSGTVRPPDFLVSVPTPDQRSGQISAPSLPASTLRLKDERRPLKWGLLVPEIPR